MTKETIALKIPLSYEDCYRLLIEEGDKRGYKREITQPQTIVWKWSFSLDKNPGSITTNFTPTGVEETHLEITVEIMALMDPFNLKKREFDLLVEPFLERVTVLKAMRDYHRQIQTGLICPRCGQSYAKAVPFCSNCGTALQATCPNCGSHQAPNVNFCSNCGSVLKT